MNDMKLKLPIGIEDFKEIRTEGFYYVDKTNMIKDLLQSWGKVNLFTRPRRFGKSLNTSMLKYFFEIDGDKTVFNGLKIEKETELCRSYMGNYPVISISLKGVNGNDYETARSMMCSIIGTEALRFHFLTESPVLNEQEKLLYAQLIRVDEKGHETFFMPDSTLAGSLKTLSMLLMKHYGRKVILLIDEYDVPLAKAFERGYYDQMVTLIRMMFEQALKTNDSLQLSVLTGCLRISKESIFTGLNNLRVLSIADVQFDEYFGFTDDEVKALLEYYQLSEYYDVIKEWYDGYHFGGVEVYCPWDVICYCDKLRVNPRLQPEDYWSNTSNNDVIRRFIEMAKGATRREIEQLMDGNAIEKTVRQELTYKELYDSIDNLWSVLFTTGYLTQQGEPDGKRFMLSIPNLEIRNIFKNNILEWFQENARQDGAVLNAFCETFRNGDASSVEKQFNAYLKKTISIRDTFVRKNMKENLPTGKATTKGLTRPNPSVCFYHGLLLGLLSFKGNWGISSNRESGDGYSDILIEIEEEDLGIVIEVKYPDNADLEAGCQEALEQIEKNRYEEILRDEGINIILKYGIACYKKRCQVVLERD